MSHVDHVHKLMEELGPSDEAIDGVARIGDLRWTVAIGAGPLIDLDLNEALGRLYLSIDLGRPPEDRRPEVYESVLVYNALIRQTGVLVALAGPGLDLVLIADLDAGSLDLATLGMTLANVEAKAGVWREIIAGSGDDPAEPEPMGLGLRV